MKLVGKGVLWGLALIVLALVLWGVCLVTGWSGWVGVALFLMCIGLYFLARFLRRMWIVMRSRSRLAEQTEIIQSIGQKSSTRAALQDKWKQAVTVLRRSSLRRFGNPLYVLPWYMLVGRSGTGKTTALTRARLTSSIQRVDQQRAIPQTQNYDWWFFDQAVLIDCAGRYVGVEQHEEDREEWGRGLDLLARYRPRGGLDGLVLTVAADVLMSENSDALTEEARVLRLRIEQLIRMFSKRFPIYVLVTKCDKIYGFESWGQLLPSETLRQAMGYLSPTLEEGSHETHFLRRAFQSIHERLNELRLSLLAEQPTATASAELLLFPAELAVLEHRLHPFIDGCMSDDPYLEKPLLRGLFFSSGLQQGGAVSQTMIGLLPPVPAHEVRHNAWFLQDFFSTILPHDRGSWRPAELVNRWQRATRDLGLLAWFLLSLAVIVFMCVSFAGNMGSLGMIVDARPYHTQLRGSFEQNVSVLYSDSQVIETVSNRNARWVNAWMAHVTMLSDLTARLRQRFVKNFGDSIWPTVLMNENQDWQAEVSGIQPERRSRLIGNRVRLIEMIQARRRGASLAELHAMPQLIPSPYYPPSMAAMLNQLMVRYLAWLPPQDPALSSLLALSRQQIRQVAFVDPQMRWLLGLAPDDVVVPAVRISDFWPGADTASQPVGIAAAWTLAGQRQIQAFIQEMADVFGRDAAFIQHEQAFNAWYQQSRQQAWYGFVTHFAASVSPIAGERQSMLVLGSVATAQSPYYQLLARLNHEFADVPDAALPGWLLQMRQFQALREQALRYGDGNGVVKWLGAINGAGGDALRQSIGGMPGNGAHTLQNRVDVLGAFNKYFVDVNQLAATAATDANKAFGLASDFHAAANGVQSSGSSAVVGIVNDVARMHLLLGKSNSDSELAWQLIEAPWRYVLAYSERQASCVLQKNWQADVLEPAQGAVGKTALVDQLYGNKGLVWSFVDGIAKPFLTLNKLSYRASEVQGYSVPFSPDFIPFLNSAMAQRVNQLTTLQEQAAAQKTAQLQIQQTQTQLDNTLADTQKKLDALNVGTLPVTITTAPLGVNAGAIAKPYAAVLKMQCAAGEQELANYNVAVTRTFNWAVGQCSDVSLRISIGQQVLVKRYPGEFGLADFLQDFQNGEHSFSADDFPVATAELLALNVHQIKVSYLFDGQWAVIARAQRLRDLQLTLEMSTQQKQALQHAEQVAAQAVVAQQLTDQQAVVANNPGSDSGVWLPAQIGQCWNQPVQVAPSASATLAITRAVSQQVSAG